MDALGLTALLVGAYVLGILAGHVGNLLVARFDRGDVHAATLTPDSQAAEVRS